MSIVTSIRSHSTFAFLASLQACPRLDKVMQGSCTLMMYILCFSHTTYSTDMVCILNEKHHPSLNDVLVFCAFCFPFRHARKLRPIKGPCSPCGKPRESCRANAELFAGAFSRKKARVHQGAMLPCGEPWAKSGVVCRCCLLSRWAACVQRVGLTCWTSQPWCTL